MPAATTCKDFIFFVKSMFPSTEDKLVPLHSPTFNDADYQCVKGALDSTFVSTVGAHTDLFENEIRNYVNAPYATIVNSGTAGLHLALMAVGVVPGSVVLTQALTFVATANAVKYCQADPIFLDVEPTSLGMDPTQLLWFLETYCEVRNDGRAWIKSSEKKISACLPVSILGHPCRANELQAICREWGVPLVEDSAESLGSFEGGVCSGTIGDVGVYSFNGNKIITTGAGGAVVCRDEAIAKKVAHLANVSKVKRVGEYEFSHDSVGYNYRMPALNAALGLAQIRKIDHKIKAKKMIYEAYLDWFAPTAIELLPPRVSTTPNFWLSAIKFESVENRNMWLESTNQAGVLTRPLWKPLNRYPQFRSCRTGPLCVTETLSQLVLTLPSSPGV